MCTNLDVKDLSEHEGIDAIFSESIVANWQHMPHLSPTPYRY